MMPTWEYCALSNDATNLYLFQYQNTGMYSDSRQYNVNLWAASISTLGSIGWEVTHITHTPSEVTWYFKRAIHQDNKRFALP